MIAISLRFCLRPLHLLANCEETDAIALVPENIRLIVQPPRSPELNAVEHVWEEIREKHFYNHVFESLDAVLETLCKGLKELMDLPNKLRSMTNFPHMRVTF